MCSKNYLMQRRKKLFPILFSKNRFVSKFVFYDFCFYFLSIYLIFDFSINFFNLTRFFSLTTFLLKNWQYACAGVCDLAACVTHSVHPTSAHTAHARILQDTDENDWAQTGKFSGARWQKSSEKFIGARA